MLPTLVQPFHEIGSGWGLRPVLMAGRLGVTLTEYRALEAGELHIDYDLDLRITDLCGWPRYLHREDPPRRRYSRVDG